MDEWVLFRPEALGLEGLGTLATSGSFTLPWSRSSPYGFLPSTPPDASSLGCEQIDLKVMFSKCSAFYLQQLKRDLLVEAVWCWLGSFTAVGSVLARRPGPISPLPSHI